jgi:hypothetical protein
VLRARILGRLSRTLLLLGIPHQAAIHAQRAIQMARHVGCHEPWPDISFSLVDRIGVGEAAFAQPLSSFLMTPPSTTFCRVRHKIIKLGDVQNV